jgi:hypothetical protein
MMAADLPPISRVSRPILGATTAAIGFPVPTLPVKLTLTMRRSATSLALPSASARTTLMTPGGMPASIPHWATRYASSGLYREGLITHVHPAASAALSFVIRIGQAAFQEIL